MNEKQKAEYLVRLFNTDSISWTSAKVCALVAVEELIEEVRDYCDNNYHQDRLNYWNNIRDEIEKL